MDCGKLNFIAQLNTPFIEKDTDKQNHFIRVYSRVKIKFKEKFMITRYRRFN